MSKQNYEPWKNSDMTYHAKLNAEALSDFNRAIDALYSLDSGAFSADTRNTPTYVDDVVKNLNVDFADIAFKLELMRSLIFGDAIDWGYCADKLREIQEPTPTYGGETQSDG
jgi:hypothetical protein